MLQRDQVWAAFGLDINDRKAPQNSDTVSNMKYPEYRFPETKKYPWPEGL